MRARAGGVSPPLRRPRRTPPRALLRRLSLSAFCDRHSRISGAATPVDQPGARAPRPSPRRPAAGAGGDPARWATARPAVRRRPSSGGRAPLAALGNDVTLGGSAGARAGIAAQGEVTAPMWRRCRRCRASALGGVRRCAYRDGAQNELLGTEKPGGLVVAARSMVMRPTRPTRTGGRVARPRDAGWRGALLLYRFPGRRHPSAFGRSAVACAAVFNAYTGAAGFGLCSSHRLD